MNMEKYYFKNDTKLSNYYMCNVVIDGRKFSSSEAAYHAEKFLDEDLKELMTKLNPDESKHVARELKRFIREDWEEVKYDIMLECLCAKFTQNPELRELLLSTGDEEILEDTTAWHDNTWGSCSCPKCVNIEGQNLLGKALVEVREMIRARKI